jgi:eukaryotic-like serine/threonine-protein kinase
VPVGVHGSLLAGRYRVLDRLGAGGMAVVWLCEDERLGRRVAVKRLHANAPAELEARFAREAKVGASLNHPNLVSVFDTAVDDEGVLIVMEYVEGEALARALRSGPLTPGAVARMARDLGEALDHAHANGVVHRDVKPGNVLLRRDGLTKLADLGIAVAADQTRITRSGTVLGSAAYMAPEQLEGGEIGPAVDVYALSAVCFEALAGERARAGRTPMEIAHSIATEGPPDVREHVPWAPAAAAEALMRGMARSPDARPASAGEVAEAVARALERSEAPATTAALPPTAATTRRGPAAATRAAPAAATTRSTRAPATTRSTPRGAHAAPRSMRSRVLAPALILLAVAAVAAAVLLSGGDGSQPEGERADGGAQADRGGQGQANGSGQAGAGSDREAPAEEQPAEEAPAAEQPVEPEPAPTDPGIDLDPARGTELNEQGFALMGQGDYAGAVPVLEKAVASWPEDSTDLNYAYALYNLGVSLNRTDRSAEAIPYLEKRLDWSNQRGVVLRELRLARANAG